jgi:hypothetical protein
VVHLPATVTSAAATLRRVTRSRSSERILGTALVAYGVVGLLLVAVLALSIAPALATLDAIARSTTEVERTLATTRDAFDGFATSLVEARRSTQQAAITARSTATTARQLADGMSISIFGVQPLVSIAGGFRQQSTDLAALADDIDALGAALSRDERDVRAVRDRISELHDRTVLAASSPATAIPLAPILYALLLWIAAQAAAAVWLGVLLWRREA